MATTPALTVTANPAPLSDEQRQAVLAAPPFGSVFTDHMVTATWQAQQGWSGLQVQPFAALPLQPTAKVLHYGQAIFEGLKAYHQPDGSVALFRPDRNAARFQRSAARMAMPELPQEWFVAAAQALVRQDCAWVPIQQEHSLYLRPFMVATEPGLGVQQPAQEYLFCVIASPAGAYFARGVAPVKVWLSTEYSRAAPGGTGQAKCAGNYAASFLAQRQATQAGCDQVVWLDSGTHSVVEEMGGMNLFFVYGHGADARLVTPALTGTLLPGITRESLLELGPALGFPAQEGTITVEQWRQGCESGQISEVFACGTAAVITPVGQVASEQGSWTVGNGQPGPVTMRLREAMLAIQHGSAPDLNAWMHPVPMA